MDGYGTARVYHDHEIIKMCFLCGEPEGCTNVDAKTHIDWFIYIFNVSILLCMI